MLFYYLDSKGNNGNGELLAMTSNNHCAENNGFIYQNISRSGNDSSNHSSASSSRSRLISVGTAGLMNDINVSLSQGSSTNGSDGSLARISSTNMSMSGTGNNNLLTNHLPQQFISSHNMPALHLQQHNGSFSGGYSNCVGANSNSINFNNSTDDKLNNAPGLSSKTGSDETDIRSTIPPQMSNKLENLEAMPRDRCNTWPLRRPTLDINVQTSPLIHDRIPEEDCRFFLNLIFNVKLCFLIK